MKIDLLPPQPDGSRLVTVEVETYEEDELRRKGWNALRERVRPLAVAVGLAVAARRCRWARRRRLAQPFRPAA